MSDEQKPESAKFRTREQQLVAILTNEGEKFLTFGDVDEAILRAALIEAEVRGAALEKEKSEAVSSERDRCVEIVRKHGISPFPIDDPNPNAEEINATLQNITAAIREGGEG